MAWLQKCFKYPVSNNKYRHCWLVMIMNKNRCAYSHSASVGRFQCGNNNSQHSKKKQYPVLEILLVGFVYSRHQLDWCVCFFVRWCGSSAAKATRWREMYWMVILIDIIYFIIQNVISPSSGVFSPLSLSFIIAIYLAQLASGFHISLFVCSMLAIVRRSYNS